VVKIIKTFYMKNSKDMRVELSTLFSNIKNGSVSTLTAKVLVATSNAILKSAALELEQNKLTGKAKTVDFLS
jgi:hypothetical protein